MAEKTMKEMTYVEGMQNAMLEMGFNLRAINAQDFMNYLETEAGEKIMDDACMWFAMELLDGELSAYYKRKGEKAIAKLISLAIKYFKDHGTNINREKIIDEFIAK